MLGTQKGSEDLTRRGSRELWEIWGGEKEHLERWFCGLPLGVQYLSLSWSRTRPESPFSYCRLLDFASLTSPRRDWVMWSPWIYSGYQLHSPSTSVHRLYLTILHSRFFCGFSALLWPGFSRRALICGLENMMTLGTPSLFNLDCIPLFARHLCPSVCSTVLARVKICWMDERNRPWIQVRLDVREVHFLPLWAQPLPSFLLSISPLHLFISSLEDACYCWWVRSGFLDQAHQL